MIGSDTQKISEWEILSVSVFNCRFSHDVVIFLSLSTSMVIKWQQSEKLDKVLSVHTDVGGLLQKQERLLYSNTTYFCCLKG